MAVIKVMSKELAGLIAAGEVVERPASVIKELLENSIDAGASNITVEIRNGGISYMRITDDGCGIARDDIRNAFVSHATSKLYSEDGLSSIGTLGFRGEALASVAAVAKVEMLTRQKGSETGTRYEIAAAEEVSLEDAGCPTGTTIVVRELFFNTPARMKFLKKDVSEGNNVAGIVDRIALSHPGISFRFIREGKQVLVTSGNGSTLDAAREIFGKSFASGLIPCDLVMEDISVKGYISRPSESRPNRNMQFFFINGRLVRTGTGSAALSEACKNSVMVGKFPSCILEITLPGEDVDVNVHPAKTEVRFSDERKVFNAVYLACRQAIDADRSVKEIHTPASADRFFRTEGLGGSQLNITDISKAPEIRVAPPVPVTSVQEKPEQSKPTLVFRSPQPDPEPDGNDLPDLLAGFRTTTVHVENDIPAPQQAKPAVPASSAETENPGDEFEEEKLLVIGEAFRTYIICQYDNKLYFIDKHAAHERMIYEELKKSNSESSQVLLSPVTVTLTKEEYSVLLENTDVLSEAAFLIEDFGPGTIAVRECPMLLDASDVPEVICEIAGRFCEKKQEVAYEKIDWLYHSVACRSAIKAGDFTSRLEMERFAKKLFSMPEIRCCPHGRPVMTEMTQRELEKNFGRV